MAGVGALTASVSAGLLRQADTDAGTATTLLKKATQADADIVAKLLPAPSAANGNIDVRA